MFELFENPVLVPDSRWFVTYTNGDNYQWNHPQWSGVDCRDMVVVKAPQGGFYGYFVTVADLGNHSPIGVVGYAYSEDLLHWDQRGIAYRTEGVGIVEMIDVYSMGGKWYMSLLTAHSYGCRNCFSDPYVNRGEIYAVSDTPEGPFIENLKDNVLIAGPNDSGYSCRTIDYKGEKRLIYVDSNCGDGVFTLPKTMKATSDGKLRVEYAEDLLAAIRVCSIEPEILVLPQNSFAWPTKGGSWTRKGDTLYGIAENRSWQSVLFNAVGNNWEMAATIDGTASSFGFVFYQADSIDVVKGITYLEGGIMNAVVIEPSNHRMYVAQPYGWSPVGYRSYPFKTNQVYHFRVTFIDNTCELYVNNELILQLGMKNPGNNIPGVFLDSGSLQLKDIEIYHLED